MTYGTLLVPNADLVVVQMCCNLQIVVKIQLPARLWARMRQATILVAMNTSNIPRSTTVRETPAMLRNVPEVLEIDRTMACFQVVYYRVSELQLQHGCIRNSHRERMQMIQKRPNDRSCKRCEVALVWDLPISVTRFGTMYSWCWTKDIPIQSFKPSAKSFANPFTIHTNRLTHK